MLRRYTPMKKSAGTRIPSGIRDHVYARDRGCVLAKLDATHKCSGQRELDHVRASGGVGMKSRSTSDNLVLLCSAAHRYKTENTQVMRPLLLEYLRGVES